MTKDQYKISSRLIAWYISIVFLIFSTVLAAITANMDKSWSDIGGLVFGFALVSFVIVSIISLISWSNSNTEKKLEHQTSMLSIDNTGEGISKINTKNSINNNLELLKSLNEMKVKGLITQQDYDKQKSIILNF
jgi:hypothetical protein